jgi:hypothetical protein
MRLIVNAREPWVPPGKNTYRKAGSLSEAPRETSDLALASIPDCHSRPGGYSMC